MKKIAYILILLFAQLEVIGQELPTKLERNKMLIGEVNTIIVQHDGALKESELLKFNTIKGKISKSITESKTVDLEMIRVEYQKKELRISFIAWDSATLVVPSFSLNKSDSITTQTLLLEVTYPETNESTGIADLYEVKIEPSKSYAFWLKYWWILDVLILLMFVLGLYLVLKFKNIKADEFEAVQIQIHERALSDLEQLMQQKLFVGEHQKVHFTAFSHILRRFIGAQYKFITFEKTSVEILDFLHKRNINTNIRERFGSLLHLADMIKFSKATADELEIKRSYEEACSLIVECKKAQRELESEEKGGNDA